MWLDLNRPWFMTVYSNEPLDYPAFLLSPLTSHLSPLTSLLSPLSSLRVLHPPPPLPQDMVVKCGICSASNLKARDELLEEFDNVAETVKEMLAQQVGLRV